MFAKQLREIREYWFPSASSGGLTEAVNDVFDQIGFTDAYKDGEIAQREKRNRRKFIKDNIWGMVELDHGSVILLDSPPIQRLRAIKQLGFSYLTYPTADHSRFSHSLGMYAVVKNFLDAMRLQENLERHTNYETFRVTKDDELDFLHAALLHDVGHCPFSHVSDYSLERFMLLRKTAQMGRIG